MVTNRATAAASVVVAIMAAACAQNSVVSADPVHTFPNIDSFVEVDSAQYRTSGDRSGKFAFTTPEGLYCQLLVNALCSGKLPGTTGIPNDSGCSTVQKSGEFAGDGKPYVYEAAASADCDYRSIRTDAKLLGAGQKLTVGKATCVVGTNSLTACTDEFGHGFVLQQSGSWLF